jgi:glyoxylase-like metal-dependent hydrolase (beta-lactamase superfamily II)
MARTPQIPIECVVTSGVFRLGAEERPVQTNVWLVGDEHRAVVIDPAHDHVEILRALGDREVMAILCTHGHNDHIDAAVALASYADAPILLHPDDEKLWNELYPQRPPDAPLLHGEVLKAGGVELQVLHTPGHTPGSCVFLLDDVGEDDPMLLSGDLIFAGSVGRTDFPRGSWQQLLASIQQTVLPLEDRTLILPGHGPDTTVGRERATNPFLRDIG